MLCSETFCTDQVLQKQVSLFTSIGHGFFAQHHISQFANLPTKMIHHET